ANATTAPAYPDAPNRPASSPTETATSTPTGSMSSSAGTEHTRAMNSAWSRVSVSESLPVTTVRTQLPSVNAEKPTSEPTWAERSTTGPRPVGRWKVMAAAGSDAHGSVLGAQGALDHLAAGVARQLGDVHEVLRPFEGGELVLQPLVHLLQREVRGAFLLHQDRHRDLAPLLVGPADHRDLDDVRMAGDRVLDLRAVDVLAAGDEHVLLTVHHVDEALGVHADQVPGVEPAAFERLGGLVRLVPVARHHGGPPVHDLPDFARGDGFAEAVDDARADRRDDLAHRSELAQCVVPVHRAGDGAHLGLAEHRAVEGLGERLRHGAQDGVGARRRAPGDVLEPERAGPGLLL